MLNSSPVNKGFPYSVEFVFHSTVSSVDIDEEPDLAPLDAPYVTPGYLFWNAQVSFYCLLLVPLC